MENLFIVYYIYVLQGCEVESKIRMLIFKISLQVV